MKVNHILCRVSLPQSKIYTHCYISCVQKKLNRNTPLISRCLPLFFFYKESLTPPLPQSLTVTSHRLSVTPAAHSCAPGDARLLYGLRKGRCQPLVHVCVTSRHLCSHHAFLLSHGPLSLTPLCRFFSLQPLPPAVLWAACSKPFSGISSRLVVEIPSRQLQNPNSGHLAKALSEQSPAGYPPARRCLAGTLDSLRPKCSAYAPPLHPSPI